MNSIGKNNFVSVVMPLFNAQNTVIPAVESVIAQTYESWELLIVDDGSKDKSYQKLEKFLNSLGSDISSKIKIFRQKNAGPSVARNFGIDQAAGEFIAFLDSDDIWIPNKLALQLEVFRRYPDAGIIGGGFERPIFDSNISEKTILFKNLLYRNYFPTPTVFIRKDRLIGKFDVRKKHAEDYLLWLEITHNYPAVYINKVLAYNFYHKREFGWQGLSSNMVKMESSELENYQILFKAGKLSFKDLMMVSSFSIIKFIRRMVIKSLNL